MPEKTTSHFTEVIKRDGRRVHFEKEKITNAIFKAIESTGEGNEKDAEKLSNLVIAELNRRYLPVHTPHIEEIQDVVEEIFITKDYAKTAKAYILYRNERMQVRAKKRLVPEHVQKLVAESRKYFKNELAEFIYYRTYSRWIENEGRRETWVETVDRYLSFMTENLGNKITKQDVAKIREAILEQRVMPSMRLMWAAGKAARTTNVSAYNCSFIAPQKIRDFAEVMYLLMCGTGVGFSAESQTVQKLPIIKRQNGAKKLKTYVIEDSKEGWADALTLGLTTWYNGKDIDFDYSGLRPAGARLNTMGGRSSGPDPLRSLLEFSRATIMGRQGKRLTNLNVHDIVCKIGEVVVAGGVRRSALISLSDLDDNEMRDAKKGQFFLTYPQRSMANNSAVYIEKPSAEDFLDEWIALAKSGSGERGIFNRGGLQVQLPERRWKVFSKHAETSGTNPCGEIVLRSKQFCNLTEVVARKGDTEKTLLEKVELAAILGTYQSTLTSFKYLSPEWKKNCEEERLLGVSITGQWDCPAVRNPETLKKMRAKAVEVNRKYAERFGINASTCVTCVKPSGTVSQLVDAASGMHPRYAQYYIRRVRISTTDPLFQMFKDQKFPHHPEVGQSEENATTYVLEFPVKAPDGAILRNDKTAIEQLEYWKGVKENFTEHNPSVTIYVGDNEWIEVANWLYKNWDILGGLSFLPRDNHVYKLAPYEEITKERYEELLSKLPKIDFSQIVVYEKDDETMGAKELACVGGVCEISS
ncbi:MAG: ATP cone domain-containing protein [Patescibacteria group bacterium]|nr:ATP cone domain-containing protein [bacterium]MDZ4241001.1 ATP cone domain-containing protein [Patescibacteria group bacterium]